MRQRAALPGRERRTEEGVLWGGAGGRGRRTGLTAFGSLPAGPGVAGVLSRTATAPIDRVKMLLQVQEGSESMTIRQGVCHIYREGACV